MFTEQNFWQLIEEAWDYTPLRHQRITLLEHPNQGNLGDQLMEAVEKKVYPALIKSLNKLSQKDLFEFNKILELKLYHIDREELHEYTDGSDDGFLYARGFIVALGEVYYNSIDQNPSSASFDLESEDFAYMTRAHYIDKFGDDLDDMGTFSGKSRETCSNQEEWGGEEY